MSQLYFQYVEETHRIALVSCCRPDTSDQILWRMLLIAFCKSASQCSVTAFCWSKGKRCSERCMDNITKLICSSLTWRLFISCRLSRLWDWISSVVSSLPSLTVLTTRFVDVSTDSVVLLWWWFRVACSGWKLDCRQAGSEVSRDAEISACIRWGIWYNASL
jgi:hypothetical protein